jgi:NTP pyrophosphatase (non-canonical NTP hydrolase)
MNFDEYQSMARSTAVYPRQHHVVYPALGISGESGEIAELVKKWLRDEQGHNMTEDRRNRLRDELGDVLWYLANMAYDLNLSLEEIASHNLQKLRSRQERDQLHGDGDDR